jgi:hypothetical protein
VAWADDPDKGQGMTSCNTGRAGSAADQQDHAEGAPDGGRLPHFKRAALSSVLLPPAAASLAGR